MRSGKNQSKPDPAPFESGIVITAEIAFAALLLYLTNHPVDLDSTLTQATNTQPEISDRVLAADFITRDDDVAVASTSINNHTTEFQISNPINNLINNLINN